MTQWQFFAKCFTVTILQVRKLRLTQASLFKIKKLARGEYGISTHLSDYEFHIMKASRGKEMYFTISIYF